VRGEALFIAGTNYQAMGALSLLKMTYDVPIVTSNFAALQAVKRQLEDLRERDMTRLSS
jgi:maleate cis-trans isomerase